MMYYVNVRLFIARQHSRAESYMPSAIMLMLYETVKIQVIIDRAAGAIIRLVAYVCVCVCVCPFICGTLLYEPFDL